MNVQTFSAIFERLDLENYLLWCQLVEQITKDSKKDSKLINFTIIWLILHHYVVEDAFAIRVSPEFESWEQ